MRKEASIEEWRKLYEAATRIRELKPWELLWDMDIIGIQAGKEEMDTVFYSILGKGGDCYGISVYEGYDAFNSFMLLTLHERMNVSSDYAMFNQNCLTCYWGNREELSAKQRETIKQLGYKYRGKDNWLYFMSYEPGYYPYNLDQDEVRRMTVHLERLEMAFNHYKNIETPVNFDEGNMFACVYSTDRDTWDYGEKPLPFAGYNLGNLVITDEKLLTQLGKAPKGKLVLEADIRPLGASVADKKYKKPANPEMSILAEAKTGMMLSCEMNGPEEDANIRLASELARLIFKVGAPREIRVSNVIVEAVLEQICTICGIKLRRVKRLAGIDEFMETMGRFRR